MRRAMLGAGALLMASAAGAAEWRETVGGWDVYADASAAGAPLCYAASDRGPGERLVFVRTAERIFLILRRRAWRLEGEHTTVALRLDEAPSWTRAAQVDRQAVVLDWRLDDPVVVALSRARTLEVEVPAAGALRVDLAGSAEALGAAAECLAEAARAPERDAAARYVPRRETPDARREAPGTDRAALARDFKTWLQAAAPEYAAAVTVAGDGFALTTRVGGGAIVLLDGQSHADVLAAGSAALGARTGTEVRVWDRHDINGQVVTRIAAGAAVGGAEAVVEAVVVSYRRDPGGLMVVVEPAAADRRALDFTAAIVEEIAEREGLVVRLRAHGERL